MITFDEFKKIKVKVGKVLTAEAVENTDKLIKMQVDFGEEKRTVVSGIRESYQPEDLINKQFPFVVNLEPREIKGIESQAMILGIDVDEKSILLVPDKEVPNGAEVI